MQMIYSHFCHFEEREITSREQRAICLHFMRFLVPRNDNKDGIIIYK